MTKEAAPPEPTAGLYGTNTGAGSAAHQDKTLSHPSSLLTDRSVH